MTAAACRPGKKTGVEIEVRIATILLKKADPPLRSSVLTLDVPEGTGVRGLVETLGIPENLVGSVTVNKRRVPFETELRASDSVAIIPAISGG